VTTFAHDMPFGAALQPDGTVRFRLWAPAQERVSLVLEDSGSAVPLRRQEAGWFELVSDAAGAGSRYRFALADGLRVPDPASRHQPADVHGPSAVVDPRSYSWRTGAWRGRPWHEAALYELHVGAFTPEGDFDGVRRRLDRLARLGVTAIELMPLAEFPGRRNWGYDGVLPFAPDASYGTPAMLKALVEAAHERELMIFLDVVYNHFGPDGNYLGLYAPQFFTERRHTPWGAAIDFSQRAVRDFFIHNALYWLGEYRFDGLRLDAVHAILDDGPTHILVELAAAVRELQAKDGRHLHLVLENDTNAARYLRREESGELVHYDAQWNDDFHHVCHVLLTGESGGYYRDYAERPLKRLGRALAEGFVYQGEASVHREGASRGEPSTDLPPTAFVDFLQNHDQVGNRAFGDRLTTLVEPQALEAMATILLLAPQIPLLFMGEEWSATQPFPFFCDFSGELADAIRAGRRREFAKFPAFSDPQTRERIPDPNAPDTFARAVLDWSASDHSPHREHLALHEELLALRHSEIVPRLVGAGAEAKHEILPGRVIRVFWRLGDGSGLTLVARLASGAADTGAVAGGGRLLRSTHPPIAKHRPWTTLPGWFVAWFLAEKDDA
jgi:maltooligosyltrehalose trehalohydrolase